MLNSFFTEVKYSLQLASIKSQFSRIWPTLIISLVIALLTTMMVASLSLYFDIPISSLTRDVTTVTGSSFYVGLLSSLGIMGWSASTAICFFGASLLIHKPHHAPQFLFLLCSGLLCLVLAVDDAFLLHEEVFPNYLNISQNTVFVLYFLVIAGYLMYFWPYILTTDYFLLIVAFLFLGSSLLVDLVSPNSGAWLFIEDGLKFFGIVFWLGYFAHTTSMALSIDRKRAIF